MDYLTPGKTAASRYAQLESNRSSYYDDAKDCSKLTIPTLIPETATGTRANTKPPFKL